MCAMIDVLFDLQLKRYPDSIYPTVYLSVCFECERCAHYIKSTCSVGIKCTPSVNHVNLCTLCTPLTLVHNVRTIETLCTLGRRRVSRWWCQVAVAGTKQVYQASPKPVINIVPVTSILGRLALVPAWENGTIPAAMQTNPSAYSRGKCDEQGRQGMGSNIFYINSWAMIWPCDHPFPKTENY